MAGMVGAVALTAVHQLARRVSDDAPRMDVLGERAIARTVHAAGGTLPMPRTLHRWALAGDQLYVDFDISEANVPAGTRLAIGSAVIEVTAQPHTGCAKFVQRFGVEAMKFVNSPRGRELHLRGINARVVVPGRIQSGDRIRKLER